MKAAVLNKKNEDLEIKDVPMPEIMKMMCWLKLNMQVSIPLII